MTVTGEEEAADVDAISKSYLKDLIRRYKVSNQTITVPCRSLTDIMQEMNNSHANFLSLDVQGAEDKVLATVDPQRFDVIMMENDGRDREKEQRAIRRIQRSGFHETHDVHVFGSGVYVKSNMSEFKVHNQRQSQRLAFKGVHLRYCKNRVTHWLERHYRK